MVTLSVVLATYNEEENLASCLDSVKDLADEIIVVDGGSTDRTVEIAKKYGAKVKITDNPPIFHINKQKAIDLATKDWILQLDADERLTPGLENEIKNVIGNQTKLTRHSGDSERSQVPSGTWRSVEDSRISKDDERFWTRRVPDGNPSNQNDEEGVNGYWIPRKNWFLGRFLMKGGQYPDYTLRLYRRGKGRLPQKDVHEQAVVDGKVGYLENPLLHYPYKSFLEYLVKWNRYNNLLASEIKEKMKDKNLVEKFFYSIGYLFLKPLSWFLTTYIRHKGFMDSWQGFVFSFFSSLRFPVAYVKYIKS